MLSTKIVSCLSVLLLADFVVPAYAEEAVVRYSQTEVKLPWGRGGQIRGVELGNNARWIDQRHVRPEVAVELEQFISNQTFRVYTTAEVNGLLSQMRADKDREIAELREMIRTVSAAQDALAKRVDADNARDAN